MTDAQRSTYYRHWAAYSQRTSEAQAELAKAYALEGSADRARQLEASANEYAATAATYLRLAEKADARRAA